MATHLPLIEFSNVTFSFSDSKVLFKELSLPLAAGKFYLIQGPSGAGKSTFLRLINRLEEPATGEIFFNGRPLADYSPPLLRRSLLYIQQSPTAVEGTVRDNLLLAFSFKNNRDRQVPDDAVLRRELDNFLLDDIDLKTNAQTLSVGQLQRLCFIRGLLLLEPEVLLLDEPASALDEQSSRIVEHTAERLCAKGGLTVLMVSHRRFEPRQVKPHMIRIAGGRVEESL